jgi:hypothetical protein
MLKFYKVSFWGLKIVKSEKQVRRSSGKERSKSMRKTVMSLVVVLFAVMVLSGCATVQSPLQAMIFTDIKVPSYRLQAPLDSATYSKVGTASCTSVIGIATGDASIDAAAKNGGITQIHHVDSDIYNILGIYVKYTTIVHGE